MLELAELAMLRRTRPAEVLRRIPERIVHSGFCGGAQLLARWRLGLEDLVAALHMRVNGLAGDEEMLNLAGPLEDAVDTHVAHDPLDRPCLLTALAQRLGSFISAATANLD